MVFHIWYGPVGNKTIYLRKIIFVYCNYNNEYKKNIYKYWNEYFETNLFNNYINEIFIDTSIEKLKELLIKKYGNESITFMEENLL